MKVWRRSVEIYGGGIENCDFSMGSWDGGWWKWCETRTELRYPRRIADFILKKCKSWKCAWIGSRFCLGSNGYRVFNDFARRIQCKQAQNPESCYKIVLKRSAGHLFWIFWKGQIQNRCPHMNMILPLMALRKESLHFDWRLLKVAVRVVVSLLDYVRPSRNATFSNCQSKRSSVFEER